MIRIFEDQASRERYRDYSNSCSNEFDDETLGAPRDRDCVCSHPPSTFHARSSILVSRSAATLQQGKSCARVVALERKSVFQERCRMRVTEGR
jgi:hypothetical protein